MSLSVSKSLEASVMIVFMDNLSRIGHCVVLKSPLIIRLGSCLLSSSVFRVEKKLELC